MTAVSETVKRIAHEAGWNSTVLDAFAAATRKLLDTPLGDSAHRDAVITLRALIQMYDEERE